MSKYRLLALMTTSMLILMSTGGIIHAQNDCGDGLPCGRIPWDLPALPVLPSPTVIPTVAVTYVAPTQTPGGPTATPAPSATPTFGVDTSDIEDQVATLGAVMQSTPMVINDLNGTPVDTSETFTELGSNSGAFFGYVRSISGVSFGQLSPLVNLGFLALILVISVKAITFLLPFGMVVLGIVRKIGSFILDFIPG